MRICWLFELQSDSRNGQSSRGSHPLTCEELLESPLLQTSRVRLTEFALGKHLASLDNDGDKQWDSLCVPLFPRKRQKIGHAYRAVLVCFKNIPTRDALDAIIEKGELDINFWPERQHLDRAIHSQLAQKYTNMDLAKSPVLFSGFEATNPVLGETTMYTSAGMGLVALFVAFLAMISGLFLRRKSSGHYIESEKLPTTNRAGLPLNDGPSIFDRVSSARSALGD